MISFYVVSLFTKVPVKESHNLLSQHFKDEVLALFNHVLTSTYFCVEGQFYEQTDGVAMGSTLSPLIANFYMEDFEIKAIETANHKPSCWYRYEDDTFVIRQNGKKKLEDFLNHLIGINNIIQFTIEAEGHLPFLDIDIYRKRVGSLGHNVYRKPTHTNLYLNQTSHHHPANKHSALSSLVHRAKSLRDQDSLAPELTLLPEVFKQNGYTH
jgi:hypothetical protein